MGGDCVECSGTDAGYVSLMVVMSLVYMIFFHAVSQKARGDVKVRCLRFNALLARAHVCSCVQVFFYFVRKRRLPPVICLLTH